MPTIIPRRKAMPVIEDVILFILLERTEARGERSPEWRGEEESYMFRRILVPLDGSREAEAALPQVSLLAQRFGSEVILTSVAIMIEGHSGPTNRYLREKVWELRRIGTRAIPIVLYGEPSQAIVGYAKKAGIELIVMCPHHKGYIERRFGQGTTRMIIRKTGIPLLAVKPNSKPSLTGLRRILLPLDGSSDSEAILPYVTKYVEGIEAEVDLVMAVKPYPTLIDRSLSLLPWWRKHREALVEETIEKNLDYLEQIPFTSTPQITVTNTVVEGDPSQTILAMSQRKRYDLIAMAIRSDKGITHWLHPRVSSTILDEAPQCILLVQWHACAQSKKEATTTSLPSQHALREGELSANVCKRLYMHRYPYCSQ